MTTDLLPAAMIEAAVMCRCGHAVESHPQGYSYGQMRAMACTTCAPAIRCAYYEPADGRSMATGDLLTWEDEVLKLAATLIERTIRVKREQDELLTEARIIIPLVRAMESVAAYRLTVLTRAIEQVRPLIELLSDDPDGAP